MWKKRKFVLILMSFLFTFPVFSQVSSHQKISDLEGNFAGVLDDYDHFGTPCASIGDLDNDGTEDLAVGAYYDSDGGYRRGAIWILFLNSDGTVKGFQKISDTEGNFTGDLDDSDYFGFSCSAIGDLDGDGNTELAVGAIRDDDGGDRRGAVWILFLNPDGTVKTYQKISNTEGNFYGILDNRDAFGSYCCSPGDINGDTVPDLVVSEENDDDGGMNHGAIWILFLNSNGTVKSYEKISDNKAYFNGVLDDYDLFGASCSAINDLNGDSIPDLAVGASGDEDGGYHKGAVWILFLNSDGTVQSYQKISDTAGNFDGELNDGDVFGRACAFVKDLNNDMIPDLAVSSVADDDGGENRGAVWILYLNRDGTVKNHQKISDTSGNFHGVLDDNDNFG
ncbi:hypothetical protein GF406_20570, partial [candidate division KSB1 bacterium]|nr:hypothetical protein [candidate division KSB1 bacterium]